MRLWIILNLNAFFFNVIPQSILATNHVIFHFFQFSVNYINRWNFIVFVKIVDSTYFLIILLKTKLVFLFVQRQSVVFFSQFHLSLICTLYGTSVKSAAAVMILPCICSTFLINYYRHINIFVLLVRLNT
jgi:hypothetical protein